MTNRRLTYAESSSEGSTGIGALANQAALLVVELRVRASPLVHALRDWLDMRRANARRNAAEMIALESFGDRPDLLLVHRSMGVDEAFVDPDATVALRGSRPIPDPARSLKAAILDVVVRLVDPFPALSSSPVMAVDEETRLSLPMALSGRRVDTSVFAASARARVRIHTYTISRSALAAARL